MTPDLKPGDRVRVTHTVEGTVSDILNPVVYVDTARDHSYAWRIGEPGVVFEKLPDPAPKWQAGDAVRINGVIYMRHPDGQWGLGGNPLTDTHINNSWRPADCAVLVKDGKPVETQPALDAPTEPNTSAAVDITDTTGGWTR